MDLSGQHDIPADLLSIVIGYESQLTPELLWYGSIWNRSICFERFDSYILMLMLSQRMTSV
jgi:hypothetical protein